MSTQDSFAELRERLRMGDEEENETEKTDGLIA
jgi:hypothetical protein